MSTDPIYAARDAYERAEAVHKEAFAAWESAAAWHGSRNVAAETEQRRDAALDLLWDARRALCSTVPTTPEGLKMLARFAADYAAENEGSDISQEMTLLANSLNAAINRPST